MRIDRLSRRPWVRVRRATEGGACGRREAVEVTPGVIIRGDSRQAPYAAEGRCGGRQVVGLSSNRGD